MKNMLIELSRYANGKASQERDYYNSLDQKLTTIQKGLLGERENNIHDNIIDKLDEFIDRVEGIRDNNGRTTEDKKLLINAAKTLQEELRLRLY